MQEKAQFSNVQVTGKSSYSKYEATKYFPQRQLIYKGGFTLPQVFNMDE